MPGRAEPASSGAVFLLMVLLTGCGTPAATTSITAASPTTTTAAAEPTTTAAPTATTLPVVELNVEWPVDGFVTVEPTVAVFGAASIGSSVTVNGQATMIVSNEKAYFEGNVTLVAGDNEISVVAESRDSSTAETTLNVRYLPEAVEEFTYFTNVSAEEVVADYAQMLSGQEAIDAAVEDGVTTPEEGVPNDYYIRNVNTQLRTLPVAPDAVVILASSAAGAVAGVRVSVDEWLSLFHEDGTPYDRSQEEPPLVEGPHSGFFGAGWGAPYWITLEGDQVVQIYQQYLP